MPTPFATCSARTSMGGDCPTRVSTHCIEQDHQISIYPISFSSISLEGVLWHKGVALLYTKRFRENHPTQIGILFDGIEGTLTYYKDGKCLGVAFRDLDKVSYARYSRLVVLVGILLIPSQFQNILYCINNIHILIYFTVGNRTSLSHCLLHRSQNGNDSQVRPPGVRQSAGSLSSGDHAKIAHNRRCREAEAATVHQRLPVRGDR